MGGAVAAIAGAVITTAGVAVGVAAGVAVGLGAAVYGGGKMINNKVKKMNETKANKLYKKANQSQILMTKMEKIAQGFKDMTQDSNRMDKLFTDFMDDMRKPKGKHAQIEKMNEKRKYNLRILQINVKHIIGSFEALQKHSIEILDTIDKAQDRFNAD